MNNEKLKKMQAEVRIGGKGTQRRKKKYVHPRKETDDKKLQAALKKLSLSTISGVEEVNMFKDDGTVIQFKNPKAQVSLTANTFVITGPGENKQTTDIMPGKLSNLEPQQLDELKKLLTNFANSSVSGKLDTEEDDEIPDFVGNFDEVSKEEVAKVTDVEKKKTN